eukprot:TRINITY_DN6471_c0_g1_i1.p1 TRINITY_DN6471_c0_g1~~TRINITY_DN6471_c0_g1_i1.p1  ORF type:complete len:216 (-),score=58.66 TRINITY_DN6471_c0_g1_i1:71-718(-)
MLAAWFGGRSGSAAVPETRPVAAVAAEVVATTAQVSQRVVSQTATARPVCEPGPESISKLRGLSTEEHQYMQANKPEAMDDWILQQDTVKDLQVKLQNCRQESKAVADGILSKETELTEASQRQQAALEAIESTRRTLETLRAQQQELLAKRGPGKLGEKLQADADAADMVAETLLETAQGASSMDAESLAAFRQQFMKSKTEKHLRLALRAALQ